MARRFRLDVIAVVAMFWTAGLASPALARTEVKPYIELDQTFLANLKGGSDDVLTYTSVAVGVDASARTRRVEIRANLRYEHQFGWGSSAIDSDIISGLAAARYSVIPGKLSIEGGALATRVRTDGLSSANGSLLGAGGATTRVYSAYTGSTLTSYIGDLAVNAAYRLGYSRVEDNVDITLGGAPVLGIFDESWYNSVSASVGMQPGTLVPFGWSLGAGYDREDVTQLDQRYTDKWVRADVTVPVSSTLALVGGAGYEDIKISQRAALLDGNGNPVIGGNGGLIADTSVPRLIVYDTDGLIWDAGVLWRPSRRTSLELRVGERYDSMHYIGSFSWRAGANSLVQIAYYDRIDSFGRAMHGNLLALPSDFDVTRNPFSGDLTGCVGGQNGGTCFNDTLAAISASNYRHQGITAQYSRSRGRWNWGTALGWSQRKFLAPNSPIFASVNGAKDNYYYAELFGAVKVDRASNLGTSLYVNYLDAGLSGIDVTNYGGYVTYNRLFGRRLSAQASLGLDSVEADSIAQIISLLGQVGVRYQF